MTKIKLFCVILLTALTTSFSLTIFSQENIAEKPTIKLETGGIYATLAYQSSDYHIAKVISLDEKLVALRYYKEDFNPLPHHLTTQSLTVFMGKYVTTIDDFTRQNPIKVGQEPVLADELKLYQ